MCLGDKPEKASLLEDCGDVIERVADTQGESDGNDKVEGGRIVKDGLESFKGRSLEVASKEKVSAGVACE